MPADREIFKSFYGSETTKFGSEIKELEDALLAVAADISLTAGFKEFEDSSYFIERICMRLSEIISTDRNRYRDFDLGNDLVPALIIEYTETSECAVIEIVTDYEQQRIAEAVAKFWGYFEVLQNGIPGSDRKPPGTVHGFLLFRADISGQQGDSEPFSVMEITRPRNVTFVPPEFLWGFLYGAGGARQNRR